MSPDADDQTPGTSRSDGALPDETPPDDTPPQHAPLDGVPPPEDQASPPEAAEEQPPADGPPPDSLAAGDTGWTALAAPGKPDGEVDTRP